MHDGGRYHIETSPLICSEWFLYDIGLRHERVKRLHVFHFRITVFFLIWIFANYKLQSVRKCITWYTRCFWIRKRYYKSASIWRKGYTDSLIWTQREVQLCFEAQFFDRWKSQALFLKYSNFYIPLTWWRHYIIYKVDYVLEYDLNRKTQLTDLCMDSISNSFPLFWRLSTKYKSFLIQQPTAINQKPIIMKLWFLVFWRCPLMSSNKNW